jgi:hypothetical protein
LRGKESNMYFRQLTIRHHEGGSVMMVYTAQHSTNPVVANFAQQMWQAQAGEVSVMTQALTERGAQPLSFTPPNRSSSLAAVRDPDSIPAGPVS